MMDVSFEVGAVSIKLIGAGISAPVRAGKIELSPPSPQPSPLQGEGGRSGAVVELALDGTAAQIASFQTSLELSLYKASLAARLPGEDWGYLKCTLPDATVWLAPVKAGRLIVARPGTRAIGSQGLRIELELEDYWESNTVSDVPLINKYGAGVTTGIQVDNHDDAGHDNFVHIQSISIFGDVPTPAIITLTSATAGLDVMLAQMYNYNGAFNAILEGEAGTTGGAGATLTPTADANCSGGYYGALAWNGTGAVWMAWTIDATNASYFGGRMFRPVLRLRDLVAAGEKIWAYGYTVTSTGEVMATGDGMVLPLDARLVVFPPMALPPWPKPPSGFAWEAFTFALGIAAEGAGAHVLNADFFCMLTCDGWVRFSPVALGLATSIRYDCGNGMISRATTGMVSHVPDGAGLLLYPGLNQKIQFLCQVPPAADIGYSVTLKLQYKARKKVL